MDGVSIPVGGEVAGVASVRAVALVPAQDERSCARAEWLLGAEAAAEGRRAEAELGDEEVLCVGRTSFSGGLSLVLLSSAMTPTSGRDSGAGLS